MTDAWDTGGVFATIALVVWLARAIRDTSARLRRTDQQYQTVKARAFRNL